MPHSAALTHQPGTFIANKLARHRDALSYAHGEVSGAFDTVDNLVREMSRGEGAQLPAAAVRMQHQPKLRIGATWPSNRRGGMMRR